MAPRLARVIGWSVVMMCLAAIALSIYWNTAFPGAPGRRPLGIEGILANAVFLSFTVIGAVLVGRLPRHPVGWLFMLGGSAEIAAGFGVEYAVQALFIEPGLPGGEWFIRTAEVAWAVGFLGLAMLFLLFPTGKLPSTRWRFMIGAVTIAFVWIVAIFISLLSLDARKLVLEEVQAPAWADHLFSYISFVLLLAASALVARFRGSRGDERQQLKWVAYSVVLAVGGLILEIVIDIVGAQAAEGVVSVMSTSSVIGIPIAAAVAVLRYRLYDIDRLINKTVVYGFVTAILAGVYVLTVFALQQALVPFALRSDLAVAGSTLTVAAIARPLRNRIQGFIDRRFYRHRYDSIRTVEALAVRLRQELNIGDLSLELGRVIRSTLAPRSQSLWISPTASGGSGPTPKQLSSSGLRP